MELFTFFTILLGFIGVCANIMLISVIILRFVRIKINFLLCTVQNTLSYASLFEDPTRVRSLWSYLPSGNDDFSHQVALQVVNSTQTSRLQGIHSRHSVYNGNAWSLHDEECVTVCSHIRLAINPSVFCSAFVGMQELMYSATSALLCLSFGYRFRAIESSSGKRSMKVIRTFLLLFISTIAVLGPRFNDHNNHQPSPHSPLPSCIDAERPDRRGISSQKRPRCIEW